MYEEELEAEPEIEIVFEVTEDPEGEYEACALGQSIYAEAKSLAGLRRNVTEAVRCHFIDEFDAPTVIVLRFADDSEERIKVGDIYPEVFGLHDVRESEVQKSFRVVDDQRTPAPPAPDFADLKRSPAANNSESCFVPPTVQKPASHHQPLQTQPALMDTPGDVTEHVSPPNSERQRESELLIRSPILRVLLMIIGLFLLLVLLMHRH